MRANLLILCAILLVLVTGCEPRPEAEKAPAKAASAADAASAPAPAPNAADATPVDPREALLKPELANATAPDTFRARFTTTKGEFVIACERKLAPLGADRFYNLVRIGFFSDVAFFRAVKGFMVQFGIHGDPMVGQRWRGAGIADEPPRASNVRGAVTFAMGGPNSRTTQLFINYDDRNEGLDGMGFAPIGKVVEGMEVVDSLYTGYGDAPPDGNGPEQRLMHELGNSYLKAQFPQLDYIVKAEIEP